MKMQLQGSTTAVMRRESDNQQQEVCDGDLKRVDSFPEDGEEHYVRWVIRKHSLTHAAFLPSDDELTRLRFISLCVRVYAVRTARSLSRRWMTRAARSGTGVWRPSESV